jgi:hypothetical protein
VESKTSKKSIGTVLIIPVWQSVVMIALLVGVALLLPILILWDVLT